MKRQNPIFAFSTPYKKKNIKITLNPKRENSTFCEEIERLLDEKPDTYEANHFYRSNEPTDHDKINNQEIHHNNGINNNDNGINNKRINNNQIYNNGNNNNDDRINNNDDRINNNDNRINNNDNRINNNGDRINNNDEDQKIIKKHELYETVGSNRFIKPNDENLIINSNNEEYIKNSDEYEKSEYIQTIPGKLKRNSAETGSKILENMSLSNHNEEITSNMDNSKDLLTKKISLQTSKSKQTNTIFKQEITLPKFEFTMNRNLKINKNNPRLNFNNESKNEISSTNLKMDIFNKKIINYHNNNFDNSFNSKFNNNFDKNFNNNFDKNFNSKFDNNNFDNNFDNKELNNDKKILKEKNTKNNAYLNDQEHMNSLINKNSPENYISLINNIPFYFSKILTENEKLKFKLELLENTNSVSKGIKNDLTKILNIQKDISKNIENELEIAKKRNNEIKKQLNDEIIKNLNDLEKCQENCKIEIKRLENEIVEKNKENDKNNSEKNELVEIKNKKIDELKIQLQNEKINISNLNGQLQILNDTNNSLDEQLKLKNKKIGDLKKEINDLKNTHQKISDGHNEEMLKIKENNFKCEIEIKEFKRKLENIYLEINNKEKENIEINNSYKALLDSKNELKEENIKFLTICQEQEKRIPILELEVTNLISEIDKSKEELKLYEIENLKLKRELSRASSLINNNSNSPHTSNSLNNSNNPDKTSQISEFKNEKYKVAIIEKKINSLKSITTEFRTIKNEINILYNELSVLKSLIINTINYENQRVYQSLMTKIKLQKLEMENNKMFYENKIKKLMDVIKKLRKEKVVFVEPGDSDVWNVFPDT
ncbi:hypothetical protein DMUE_2804 [Dictyocoela muelleri]|nr:hypothetical protein DMUE_2804 [Dictyocoela muelleri]